MHGFSNAGYFLTLGFLSLIGSMAFWFRDVISEGTAQILYFQAVLFNYVLNIAKAVSKEEIKQALYFISKKISHLNFSKDQLGFYLAGLIEGDGCISLPAIGNTKLNRVLNPRIVFTSHINNIGLYAFLQFELGGIGRFQITGNNTLRYIIGDVEGIKFIINLIHGKLRTPKNQRFNKLIEFMNTKYSLNIAESLLDKSDLADNSWFAGFTEADGHFGVKVIEAKPKSETRKRSVSESVSIFFRLDQRSYDNPTASSMLPIMEKIAQFLGASNLLTYTINNPKSKSTTEMLSVSITSLEKFRPIVDYFNKYPLLGVKGLDFKDWEKVFNMIISKEHITEVGRLKVREIKAKMNSKRTF